MTHQESAERAANIEALDMELSELQVMHDTYMECGLQGNAVAVARRMEIVRAYRAIRLANALSRTYDEYGDDMGS